MKCISFSLFGYDRARHKDCFDFHSFLRGFFINLRMCRLIYHGWEVILHIDNATYKGYKALFDALREKGICTIDINEDGTPLCKAMLWRLKPVFIHGIGKWKYTHILCRDLDSPVTYKEAQAVEVWINNDKALHAITDSDSHNVPLMGGMIGIRPAYFTDRMDCRSWDMLFEKCDIDFSVKGSDQTFLNLKVYPNFTQHGNDSITQHYFEGMPKTYLSDYHTCRCVRGTGHAHNCPNNIQLDLPDDMKESNDSAGHIGCAGWYEGPAFRLFRKYWERFEDILEIEKQYTNIFSWAA